MSRTKDDLIAEQLASNSVVVVSVEAEIPIPASFTWRLLRPQSGWWKYLHLPTSFPPSQVNQYTCSPLDYGARLQVFVNDTKHGQFVQSLSYPPVKLEQELLSHLSLLNLYYQAALVLPNDFWCCARLSIHQGSQLHIHIHKYKPIVIKLKEESPTSLPPRGFLRIYPQESNTLGIYVYNHLPALRTILPKLKQITHFGYYLKFLFEDRLNRDAFICVLMRQLGCIFHQQQSCFQKMNFPKTQIRSNLNKNLEYIRPESSINPNYCNLKQNERKIKENYLEDSCVYKKKKAFRTQASSLDKKQSQSNKYISTLPSQIIQSSTSSEDYKYYGIKNLKKEQQHKQIIHIPQLREVQEGEESQRFLLNRKIDQLQCQNMELLEKNQELKTENLRLKSLKNKHVNMGKMLQLKNVVKTMSHRLISLEKLNSPHFLTQPASKIYPTTTTFSPQKHDRRRNSVKRNVKSPKKYHA